MAKGDPVSSPYLALYTTDNLGRVLSVSMVFNNTNRRITRLDVHRDPGCRYTQIPLGLGADGTPQGATKKLTNLADGDSQIPAAVLPSGIVTVEDWQGSGNLTAAP